MNGPIELARFWGKARPVAGAKLAAHPLPFHMLDVAACAESIIDKRPITLRRAAALLALDEEATRAVLPLAAALHDIGKFAAAFQAKATDQFPRDVFGVDADKVLPRSEHDADGRMLWEGLLGDCIAERIWPGGRAALDLLVAASVAHHGRPVAQRRSGVALREVFLTAGLDAALAAANSIVDLLHPTLQHAKETDEERLRRASFWFSGLFTLADWVGSNQDRFPYAAPEESLEEYWIRTRASARNAVNAAGLANSPSAPLRAFQQISCLPATTEATPLQQWAEQAPLPSGPLLILIEDVTGSGKTEAAQMLTHRLMAAGRVSGAYWGMPTQATANAMYLRQAKMLTQLFEAGARPSLILTHGQAQVHECFSRSILADVGPDEESHGRQPESDETASAACAAFLAEDRRAAMVADIGAGTVDQVLLAALPARFHTVRLFGLAEKALVLDEVHAYDAYMGAEIEGLARFQAALGGSAIVLSATLPTAQRERLVRAWRQALGQPARGALALKGDYPLVTVVSREGVDERSVAAAASSRRTTPVRFVENPDAILDLLENAARQGGAVAWVRNTVDDAIESADCLRERGLDPLLFHARFAQGDRQEIEQAVMARLGKDATPELRRGTIVVATQVIEQSLDLDFDFMASDLAPIDLLIQRAGRLRRHRERDAGRPDAEDALLVLSPPYTVDPRADWLSASFARASEWIYKDPSILWRTRRVLGEAGAIVAPESFRDLIEAVYASDADTPEGLRSKADRAAGAAKAERSLAQMAIISLDDGYVGEARAWLTEEQARTRLGEPETTLRLARVLPDGSLAPLLEDEDLRRAWSLSEVRVRAHRAPMGAQPLRQFRAAAERARRTWGPRERDRPDLMVLPLVETQFGLTGSLETKNISVFQYDQRSGLKFETPP